ncbi:hypothetical protein CEXT_468751 [Caerostris extrusa]|uniref:Uncharacterized protein n=1 Tax=Caerostris extrusa TaxID=172846 RepID=A0AAV4P477_CAEEX|nr:hypothetical protein CEXT_468751 [Caerostris extrusa]
MAIVALSPTLPRATIAQGIKNGVVYKNFTEGVKDECSEVWSGSPIKSGPKSTWKRGGHRWKIRSIHSRNFAPCPRGDPFPENLIPLRRKRNCCCAGKPNRPCSQGNGKRRKRFTRDTL